MKSGIGTMVGIVVCLMSLPVFAATPMRVALIVDTSAGTIGAIAQIRTAVRAFLEALPSEHEVLIVTTGRRTQVRVPPTLDRLKLKDSVAGLLSENGPTPLMDALLEVDNRFMRKSPDRWPVFVVVTGDGAESSQDNDDQAFNRWIVDLTRRGMSANAVVIKTAGNGLPESIATAIARATRGHYVVMSNGVTLPETMKQLAEQLVADAARRP